MPITESLELEEEYPMIVKSLENTNKHFTIKKETITTQSLSNIFKLKPKILHISCHGDFDSTQNEYYLAVEDWLENTGLQSKLYGLTLSQLLSSIVKQPQSIILAFVMACKCEFIGEIFRQAGIPIVICVNSESKISDEVCRVFSESFYNSLLSNQSILTSFQHAKDLVATKDSISCMKTVSCWDHEHDDDCLWYKQY